MFRLLMLAEMVLLVFSLWGGRPPQDPSPSELLEKGIYAEESIGDLEEAIRIYSSIVEQARSDRACTGQALLRLGKCHRKKGNKAEAARAFQMLIKEYSDQAKLVAEARRLLPGMESHFP